MSVTDPIADMFTCLRNASRAGHEKVDVPASRVKKEIIKILKEEGFIKNYRLIEDRKQGILRVYLKYYGAARKQVISDLKRVSSPGRRLYVGKEKIPRVLGGVGLAILSTPEGIMTDKECREKGVGGEVLGYIW